MMMFRYSLVVFLALAIAACGSAGEGTLRVELTDAPGDYDEVNVTISRVDAHQSGEGGGWKTLADEPGTFDLLELQDGLTAVLGEEPIPAGTYTQFRMILTSAEAVTGETTHSSQFQAAPKRASRSRLISRLKPIPPTLWCLTSTPKKASRKRATAS